MFSVEHMSLLPCFFGFLVSRYVHRAMGALFVLRCPRQQHIFESSLFLNEAQSYTRPSGYNAVALKPVDRLEGSPPTVARQS